MGYDLESIRYGFRELLEMNLDEFVGGQALVAPFSLSAGQPLKRTYLRGEIENISVSHSAVTITFSWIARSQGGTYEFDSRIDEEQHFVISRHKQDSNGKLILVDESQEEIKLFLPDDEDNIDFGRVRENIAFKYE